MQEWLNIEKNLKKKYTFITDCYKKCWRHEKSHFSYVLVTICSSSTKLFPLLSSVYTMKSFSFKLTKFSCFSNWKVFSSQEILWFKKLLIQHYKNTSMWTGTQRGNCKFISEGGFYDKVISSLFYQKIIDVINFSTPSKIFQGSHQNLELAQTKMVFSFHSEMRDLFRTLEFHQVLSTIFKKALGSYFILSIFRIRRKLRKHIVAWSTRLKTKEQWIFTEIKQNLRLVYWK